MNTNDWALALVFVLACLCALACAIAWKAAYADGWEAGRLYERNRQSNRRISERLSARNRTGPVPASPGTGHPPWVATFSHRLSDTRVLFEIPGGHAYRPAGDPYTDTTPISMRTVGRFPSLVASTDRYIERMRRQEEDYRRELTS